MIRWGSFFYVCASSLFRAQKYLDTVVFRFDSPRVEVEVVETGPRLRVQEYLIVVRPPP